MRIKSLVAAMAAVASLAPVAAQAQSSSENPWMVRARAVYTDWQNGQANGLNAYNITAQKEWIPEVDISYFFTKNIATELVLTYPQNVNINVGGNKQGTIKALPPSLVLQYHFTDFGAFKPYVGAGVNYTIFSDRNNILGGAASVSSSSFGAVGQIGMDYMFDKNWGLNLDVKYITMSTDVSLNGANIGKLNLNPWTPAVGVTYKF
ncbi:OmpW family protein [Polynucleobacter sp. es-EL-1]|jgi:outer membrane protein|uniref:OmpW/AlkL family protein n=1 Tax=Polynucleobacter sp. es-EL-1 TaxID=1855652 RepID=UPI001BFD3AEC|nr:OmpW family outer membrane protein [Polynucleobacter sp. es-EL-1]QWE11078.1 OmpW family protein [Polynucleobacter sp. es-EL-1]